jgi:hypothetical protein
LDDAGRASAWHLQYENEEGLIPVQWNQSSQEAKAGDYFLCKGDSRVMSEQQCRSCLMTFSKRNLDFLEVVTPLVSTSSAQRACTDKHSPSRKESLYV